MLFASAILINRGSAWSSGVQFINTGSVGRPKDGDPRACYVTLAIDGSGVRVEFVRVAYDIDEAARAIRESELPL